MTPLQRDMLRFLGPDETSYEHVAQSHGMTAGGVAEEFGAALLILADVFDEPLP
jgi:hypothetical protein